MKHKTRLLPLAGLLLAGGILCTGCGGAAPASSAPAAVSTASSVEEVSAMDGYDYLNDYIGLWGYYDIDLWLRVHEDLSLIHIWKKTGCSFSAFMLYLTQRITRSSGWKKEQKRCGSWT